MPIHPDSVQLPFEVETTGSTKLFMTGNPLSIGGGGGVEDEAVKENYWTKNPQIFTFGAREGGQTAITITTTTTQCNYGALSGEGLGSWLIGVWGARDTAVDVTYSE